MTLQESIEYLNGLTRFVFEKDTLVNIAYKRQVMDFCRCDVPQEIEDYCLIDLYEKVVNGPWSVASSSLQHGNFRQDVGSETVTAAVIENIKEKLKRLYQKYGLDEEATAIDDSGVSWVNEECDCYDY